MADGTTNIDTNAIKNSLEKCKTILKENVTKSNYSKAGNNSYTLTISDSRVITGIIGELENSGILPQSLGEALESELLSKTIKITVNTNSSIIVEIENTGTINIEISDKMIKVVPKVQDDETVTTILISKEQNGNQLTYRIDYDMADEADSASVSLNMQYSNLEGQTVKENYTLGLMLNQGDESISYDYTLINTKKFVNKIEIEPLKKEDAVVLNEQTQEYINTLFTTLATVVGQVNGIQMQQLGISEAQNPLIYATPLGIMMYAKNEIDDPNGAFNQNVDEEAAAILNFNTPIKRYEGMQTGTATKNLIQAIISSNQQNPEHIVSINGMTDGRELVTFSSSLTSSQSYNIIITQDEQTKYITAINII